MLPHLSAGCLCESLVSAQFLDLFILVSSLPKPSFSFPITSVSWGTIHQLKIWRHLVQALTVLREVMTFWLACPRQESILSYSKISMLVSLKAKINCNSLIPLLPEIELYLLFLPQHFRKKGLGQLHWKWVSIHRTVYCYESCIKSSINVAL